MADTRGGATLPVPVGLARYYLLEEAAWPGIRLRMKKELSWLIKVSTQLLKCKESSLPPPCPLPKSAALQ
jgi:hypothetical protein